MIRGLIVWMVSIVAASSGAAQDISLRLPLDCTLGKTCYIQQYMDHDSGPKAQDYLCSPRSKNIHNGTDFALNTIDQMHEGVDVVAAAAGVVLRTRKGRRERFHSLTTAKITKGRECGNAVLLLHANGWETQYCHMQKGSVSVKKGQRIEAGQVLGRVGLSGRTHFPHMHFIVRKDGKYIDPFAPAGNIVCGKPSKKTLWEKAPTFRGGGILDAGFTDHVPSHVDIKFGRAAVPSLSVNADSLVLISYLYGTQKGDILAHDIRGPNGWRDIKKDRVTQHSAFQSHATGRKHDADGWARGRYTGTIRLMRANKVIDRKVVHIDIR